jgi:type IV secretory pathway component VirB8
MVILLFTLIAVLAIFLISAIIHIKKIQDELVAIDKEQHIQNNDIIMLMKKHMTHQEMLLQHIEILKYLVEQDPKLNSGKMYFTGPVGEA